MVNKNFFIACFVGVISGIIAAIFTTMPIFMVIYSLFYVPGLTFGVVTTLYFQRVDSLKKDTEFGLWVLMCTISYLVAHIVAFQFQEEPCTKSLGCGPTFIGYFIAGVVGAALLTLSYYFLIKKLSFIGIVVCILLGGVLSLLMYLPILEKGGYFILFIGWQGGMFGLLYFFSAGLFYKRESLNQVQGETKQTEILQ